MFLSRRLGADLCVAGSLVLVALVASTGAVEWVNAYGSPLLPTTPLLRLATYAALACVAGGLLARDWAQLGPTMALEHGAVALSIAWFFTVPLAFLSAVFVESFCALSIGTLGLLSAALAWRCFECPCGPIVGLAACCCCLAVALNAAVLRTITELFGTVLLFVVIYFVTRYIVDITTSQISPTEWCEGISIVDPSSDEYRHKVDEFELACVAFSHKYPFWLQMKALYRVDDAGGAGAMERKDTVRHLFHGTTKENAQGIVCDGFRLPKKGGMFGKGIYFADCPLKSWQYTNGDGWRPGVILVCWVDLGCQSRARKARPSLTRPPRRSIFEFLRGKRRYESVVADDEASGGAVRVPEYVVYDAKRAQVDYIFEVVQVLPGTPLRPQRPAGAGAA